MLFVVHFLNIVQYGNGELTIHRIEIMRDRCREKKNISENVYEL